VFRMSCIYGTRQFGFEDQGWLAWFIISSFKKTPLTIYGDGKQVRDVLFVADLIQAFDRFLQGKQAHAVYNMGGGPTNTLSLLELLQEIEKNGVPLPPVKYAEWRMFDQKVYISDISKAVKELNWKPQVSVREGIKKLMDWVQKNAELFA